MAGSGHVTQGLHNAARFIKFHNTACVDIREQPFIGWQPARHAFAKTGVAQR